MIFVLEGPDGTGKTSLAKRICERLDAKYLHLGYRWKDKINLYHDAAIRRCAKQSVSSPVVLDRWWPSESLYAKAYRGGSQWPLHGRMAERIARRFGVVYIYCLPESVDQAQVNHEKNKKLREEHVDDVRPVSQLYLDLYYGNIDHVDRGHYVDQLILNGGIKNQSNVLSYSINQWGHVNDVFIDLLVEKATELRQSQYRPALNPYWWNISGHMKEAKYLFVGEQVNPKFRDMFWPFHEYGNSSLYLTEALHKINYKEEWGMWCNIFNHDGSTNYDICDLLEQKDLKVLALGNKAANVLEYLDVKMHAKVPHPSYAKRFNKVDLVEVFKHAICD